MGSSVPRRVVVASAGVRLILLVGCSDDVGGRTEASSSDAPASSSAAPEASADPSAEAPPPESTEMPTRPSAQFASGGGS